MRSVKVTLFWWPLKEYLSEFWTNHKPPKNRAPTDFQADGALLCKSGRMTARTMRSPQEGSAYPKCRNVCRIVFLPRHWQSCLLVKKYGLPAIWHSSSTGLFTTAYRHGDMPWQMKQCGTQKSSGVRCIFLECDDTDTARRFTKQTEKKCCNKPSRRELT